MSVLLSNVESSGEEIDSLCKFLIIVSKILDISKACMHMDIYFSCIKELMRSNNVSSDAICVPGTHAITPHHQYFC